MPEDFTYEDIYELLIAEKNSSDLQKFDDSIIQKIKEYFSLKDQMMSKQEDKSGFFNTKQQDVLTSEINNAKRALRDLYERRERKIINRALFSTRTNTKVIDTTNMSDGEIEAYKKLIAVLKDSHTSFFNNFNGSEIKAPTENTKPTEPKELKGEFKKETVILKLKEEVPELTDTELNKYGPFKPGDIVELPKELGNLLLAQDKAEEETNEIAKDNN